MKTQYSSGINIDGRNVRYTMYGWYFSCVRAYHLYSWSPNNMITHHLSDLLKRACLTRSSRLIFPMPEDWRIMQYTPGYLLIPPRTRWLPSYRGYFLMHFCEWKKKVFWLIFQGSLFQREFCFLREVVFQGSLSLSLHQPATGLYNGMVSNNRQAIV